jgi:hypothetical protein
MTLADHCTTSRTRSEYLSLRRVYEPSRPTLIIVAESPPASGRYFYNPQGSITEPLFAALVKQLGVSAASKEAGLLEFQRHGWVLVDATYQPVNALSPSGRNAVVRRDYPQLRQDLRVLTGGRSTPLLLLKANICRILEPQLIGDGFNVINRGRVVYFPSTGQQLRFHGQFAGILVAAGSR